VNQGGWLGWGLLSRPIIPGMFSIDNEFLLVRLAYGNSGFLIFLLIAVETFRRLILLCFKLKAQENQAFAFVLLGAMAVFWISIATVYMGEQIPQVAFLLIGWSGSILPESALAEAAPADAVRSKFSFKRIFS
jgi:hypothetical protein